VSPGPRVVASLVLAALAYATMQMMVVPALPEIQRDLGVDAGATAWLVSAFLLSTTIGTPVLGRLGDVYGKERVLMAVLAVFALGGLVGALAGSLPVLIFARVLQGLGGAVFPLAYGLARDALPPARVPLAIGLIAGSFGIGGSLGLVLCGPLVELFSWHAIFWCGIALPLTAIVGIRTSVPASPRRPPVPLDWIGALGLAGALLPLLIGVAQARTWGVLSAPVLALVLGGIAGLVAWGRWELSRAAPLIDLRLMARRSIWPVNGVAVLVGFSMYATGYLVPQFVQGDPSADGFGFGANVTETGLFLLPALLAGLLAGAGAGALGGRIGSKLPLRLGVATMIAGYGVLAFAHEVAWPVYVGTLLAHGIGLNLAYTAMSNLIVAASPAEQVGESSGMNTMLRTVGGALGSQLAGALVAGADTASFTTAFLFLGAISVVALLLSGLVVADRVVR
jgi:MFS family permease